MTTEKKKLTPAKLEANLRQFTGTNAYHKFSILAQKMVATDGVIYLAKQASAFWLLDVIASYQMNLLRKRDTRDFQLWTLTMHESGGATVIGSNGNNGKLIKQKIDFTDFPLKNGITLYVERGCVPDGSGGVKDVWVVMLPSER